MNDFQLIAIKPLPGCDIRFRKRLIPGEPYCFYQGYRIVRRDKETEEILDEGVQIMPRLYDLKRKSSNTPLYVQVSAIAGKNGAGKSSLVELLYVALYNLSFDLELLEKPGKNEQPYIRENSVAVDIYYRVDDYYYRLRSDKNKVGLLKFTSDRLGFEEKETPISETLELKKLFYSIVINYSQYGLNTEDLGLWVRAIFHKNDGYQTPIVLNPYRDKGNININSENYLVKARLLVNIVENNDFVLKFDGLPKVAKQLYFKFNRAKIRPYGFAKIIKTYWSYFEAEVLPLLYQYLYRLDSMDFPRHQLSEDTKRYIFIKLLKISRKYDYYKDYREFYTSGNQSILINFLADLSDDPSHITFKLRQAMNFLRFNSLFKSKRSKRISIVDLKAAIEKIQSDHPKLPTIDLIPPSFFSADIEFSSPDDSMSKLSSGEKQKVYALSSLVYHLRNLDSIFDRTFEKDQQQRTLVHYEHVNIIFDEVELYYHPELQRRFIRDLLDNIENADLKKLASINLLFITHSPFILSDIPHQNVLYLAVEKENTVSVIRDKQTFGGNIHDLLANSFFLDQKGFLGEFAKDQINSAADFLMARIAGDKPKQEWERNSLERLIDLIGEPLLAHSLRELFIQAYFSDNEIDEQIRLLQQVKQSRNTL